MPNKSLLEHSQRRLHEVKYPLLTKGISETDTDPVMGNRNQL